MSNKDFKPLRSFADENGFALTLPYPRKWVGKVFVWLDVGFDMWGVLRTIPGAALLEFREDGSYLAIPPPAGEILQRLEVRRWWP